MDSITGLISMAGFIYVYVAGCIAIVNIGANAIHMVPNNVLSWVGGTMINNFGQGMENHTAGAGKFGDLATGAGAALREEASLRMDRRKNELRRSDLSPTPNPPRGTGKEI